MAKKQELNHFKVDTLKAQMANETEPFKRDMYLAMIRDEARKAGYQVQDNAEGIFFIEAPKEVKESPAIQIEAPKTEEPKVEAAPVEQAPVVESAPAVESAPQAESQPVENAETKLEEKTEQAS